MQRAKIFQLILIAISFVSLHGCIVVQSSVPADKKPNPESAYVYGNFILTTSDNVNLSIILQESNAKAVQTSEEVATEYYIGFSKNPDAKVSMIEVPPGQYNMNGLMNLQKDMMGYAPRGRSALFRSEKPVLITLKANNAYYIGDFSGSSSVSCSYSSCYYQWRLNSLQNAMQQTTEHLKNTYTHFNAVETHNMLIEILNQVKESL